MNENERAYQEVLKVRRIAIDAGGDGSDCPEIEGFEDAGLRACIARWHQQGREERAVINGMCERAEDRG